MTQSLIDFVTGFVRQQEGWAIPIAFLVAFGESLCFLSIVWPGWAILTALAFLLAASGVGTTTLIGTVVAAGIGGVVGYSISYWIGLYFKDSIRNIWPFSSHPTLIPRGEEFFHEHGLWSVFLGHFIGPVRAVIPVIAGMFSMPQVPFQVANVTSAFIWAAWAILWPVLFVAYQGEILEFMRSHELIVALVLFALAFANAVALPLLFVPTIVVFAFVGGVQLFIGGNFWVLFAAGALGAFLGDLFFYRAGATEKTDFSEVWYLRDEGRGLPEVRKLVREAGPMSVITSKVFGSRRALVPVAAGAEAMPFAQFAAASAVAAVLWSAVLLGPGLALRAFYA